MNRPTGGGAVALLALLLAGLPCRAAGLVVADVFLAAYLAAAPDERGELARRWIERRRAAGGFPVTGADGSILFLYHGDGDEEDVRLVGDWRTKSPANVYWDERGEPMERVAPEFPLFVVRLEVEPDARLDYAFVVDGERLPDPLNARRIFSGTGGGEVSELVMPGYRLDPVLLADPPADRGTLHPLDAPWVAAPITVYLPPGHDPAGSYPTLYTADGTAWSELLDLPAVLDRLIASGEIEPLVAVMVDPPKERGVAYHHDPELLSYLERVVVDVDGRYATRRDPRQRVHAGTSAGGRASLVAALERPDLFGRVAGLSPALTGPLSFWQPYLTGGTPFPPGLEVWMSAGSYESVLARDVEVLADLLRRQGVAVTTVTTHEGHSFGTWRNRLPAMLRHFFAPPPPARRPRPRP